MFCSFNLRLPYDAPLSRGKRGVTFPYFIFHLTVPETTKHVFHFFFFSRGNQNLPIDFLLPEIHLPPTVTLLVALSLGNKCGAKKPSQSQFALVHACPNLEIPSSSLFIVRGLGKGLPERVLLSEGMFCIKVFGGEVWLKVSWMQYYLQRPLFQHCLLNSGAAICLS